MPEQWPPATETHVNGVQPDQSVPRSHAATWPADCMQTSQDCGLETADAMETTNSTSFDRTESSSYDASGRMPTPIQANFSTNLRATGQYWAEVAGRNGLVNMGHQQTSLAQNSDGTWQTVQHNHTLPSPISENDNASPDQAHMVIDGCQAHSTQYPEMQHSNAMMDVERLPIPEEVGDVASPSPPRKSHTRNLHTVNSWTWQPGMKKSFSIGFRADCDKCRDKVPGHFNHIVIS